MILFKSLIPINDDLMLFKPLIFINNINNDLIDIKSLINTDFTYLMVSKIGDHITSFLVYLFWYTFLKILWIQPKELFYFFFFLLQIWNQPNVKAIQLNA